MPTSYLKLGGNHKRLTNRLFSFKILIMFALFTIFNAHNVYKQKFVGMLVPFGASAGAGSFNGWNLPNFAVVRKWCTSGVEGVWSSKYNLLFCFGENVMDKNNTRFALR